MPSALRNDNTSRKSAVLVNRKTGREYVLGDATTLGRMRKCDVPIMGDKVSRYHARIIRSGGSYVIEDLESRNGTYVENRRVHDAVPLKDGYRIVIGDATFLFSLRKAAAPASEAEHPSVLLDREMTPNVVSSMKAAGHSLLDESLARDDSGDTARLRSQARAFRETVRRLRAQRGLDALIEELAKQFMQVFVGVEHSLVALREEEGGITICADERRDPKDRAPVRISRSIIDRAMAQGTAFVTQEEIGDTPSEHGSGRELIYRVAVIAPLILPERTIGMVYMDGLTPACRFGKHDLSLMVAIANEATQWIDSLQLHEPTRRERDRLRKENERLKMRVSPGCDFAQIVGPSKKVKLALGEARRVSRTDVNVLIQGEAGTGKELFARVIHANSKRQMGPFVHVSCGGLDPDVLEEEFLGQEHKGRKGEPRRGFIESAGGGTLYLKNVDALPLEMQVEMADVLLLRALRRVGGVEPIEVDIRIITAAQKNLGGEVKEKRFNEDLYHLLSAVHITLPPLSERAEDIPALTRHFCSTCCDEIGKPLEGFTSDGVEALQEYDWPGNVRELRNLVECLVLSAKPGSSIGREEVVTFIKAKQRL